MLKNQGLSEPLPDPDAALDRLVAVQTQYAMSLEVALAVRSKKRVRGWEARALAEDGHLVKAWGLRRTLHCHGPAGWALVHGALGERWHDRFHTRMPLWQPGRDFRVIEEAIIAALESGPKTRGEIHALVPELAGLEMAGWGADVMGAAYRGRLRVIGRGAEQRFALSEPPVVGEAPLLALARAYFQAYGPATLKDFSYWSGLPQRDLEPAFKSLLPELGELEGRFYLVGGEVDVRKPPRAALLAKFDPLTMGHSDKRLWLDPNDHGRIFRKAAQVEAVVLLKGRASGTWRVARKPRSAVVTIEPFRKLRPTEEAAIVRSAERVGKSIGWGDLELAFE